jgi:Phage tail tube protein, GTA-gp10
MANAHRGEISAIFNEQPMTLCLTLGALAELEHAYGGEDILALAERFEQGRIKASDAICVIGAGLRGAGHSVTNAEVANFKMQDGAAGFVQVVVALLKATFAVE